MQLDVLHQEASPRSTAHSGSGGSSWKLQWEEAESRNEDMQEELSSLQAKAAWQEGQLGGQVALGGEGGGRGAAWDWVVVTASWKRMMAETDAVKQT